MLNGQSVRCNLNVGCMSFSSFGGKLRGEFWADRTALHFPATGSNVPVGWWGTDVYVIRSLREPHQSKEPKKWMNEGIQRRGSGESWREVEGR